jgi:hypothetical protein
MTSTEIQEEKRMDGQSQLHLYQFIASYIGFRNKPKHVASNKLI